jgi:hypothetical protein
MGVAAGVPWGWWGWGPMGVPGAVGRQRTVIGVAAVVGARSSQPQATFAPRLSRWCAVCLRPSRAVTCGRFAPRRASLWSARRLEVVCALARASLAGKYKPNRITFRDSAV